VLNCFIVFFIFGMVFGVLSKNGQEEQSKTIHTPNEFGTTKCGENKEEQPPDKKDIAQSQLPGRCERAKRRKSEISSRAIIEHMFVPVKQVSAAGMS
jgi:hypothetical protein